MKRTIGLASVALLCLSSNAFAAAQRDKPDTSGDHRTVSVILAQASGGTGSSGGPAASEPGEKAIGGKRKSDMETGAKAAPGATDKSGTSGEPDASQSKRKDSMKPAQSSSK